LGAVMLYVVVRMPGGRRVAGRAERGWMPGAASCCTSRGRGGAQGLLVTAPTGC
jgi:hypothetical protein